MAGDHGVVRCDEDRVYKSELADAGGNLVDLVIGMGSSVLTVFLQLP